MLLSLLQMFQPPVAPLIRHVGDFNNMQNTKQSCRTTNFHQPERSSATASSSATPQLLSEAATSTATTTSSKGARAATADETTSINGDLEWDTYDLRPTATCLTSLEDAVDDNGCYDDEPEEQDDCESVASSLPVTESELAWEWDDYDLQKSSDESIDEGPYLDYLHPMTGGLGRQAGAVCRDQYRVDQDYFQLDRWPRNRQNRSLHRAQLDGRDWLLDTRQGKRRRKKSVKTGVGSTQEISDDGKNSKTAPNFFVGIQVSNPEILGKLREVQLAVVNGDDRLKDAMIPIVTLHLTVMVMHLASEDELWRAKEALKSCYKLLASRFDSEILGIPFHGLGHFNNQVVFAKIAEGPHISTLYEIADIVEKCFNSYNISSTGERGFKPHLTIMKLSRAPSLRRKGVRRIKSELYKIYSDENFGVQIMKGLQLCSISRPKMENGYFHKSAEMFFTEGAKAVALGDKRGEHYIMCRSILIETLQGFKDSSRKKASGKLPAAIDPPATAN